MIAMTVFGPLTGKVMGRMKLVMIVHIISLVLKKGLRMF